MRRPHRNGLWRCHVHRGGCPMAGLDDDVITDAPPRSPNWGATRPTTSSQSGQWKEPKTRGYF